MAKSAQRQLIVFPRLRVHTEVDLGRYLFVSSTDINQFPKKYRAHVSSFASMYSAVGQEINDVGILIRKTRSNKLAPLNDSELEEIPYIVDALAFAACYKESLFTLARDNFAYTIWSFLGDRPPTEHVSLSSRRIRFNVVQNKPHLLQIPVHTHYASFNDSSFDSDILEALLRCASTDTDQSRRLMRAIQWFNAAHSDSEDITDHSRFAMTAIAFEALLNTPHEKIRQYFSNTIQMLLGESPELSKWSKKFYDDRSSLVHGSNMPELMYGPHKHNSMLNLADIVFTQCVFRQLGLLGYLSADSERFRRKSVVRYLISNKERFKAISDFTLNSGEEKSHLVRDYLYTIQKVDASVTLKECNDVAEAVINIGLDGLSRTAKSSGFKSKAMRSIIGEYRDAFTKMLDVLPTDKVLNVYQSLRSIPSGDVDTWDDPHVRGHRFGRAKAISLDTLVSALYDIEELRTNRLFD